MKSISVSVDDETHRMLQTIAAEQGTSVLAMIMRALETSQQTGQRETERERHRRELMEITDKSQREGIGISLKDNQTIEEMYQRYSAR